MFNYEEIDVLRELDLLFVSIDECVTMLNANIDEAEDEFSKEFLQELINKIKNLSDKEYEEAIYNALQANLSDTTNA